jgi:alpha-ketoglutarate-dependent taurine dioxygenase
VQQAMTADFVSNDISSFRDNLLRKGWAVLSADIVKNEPVQVLEQFGVLAPQYNGKLSFEVTYQPGYDDAPYSQSMNGLGAHTEAPGYEPPPKYLALHCHRQARCGKGHTLLADAIRFFDMALEPELRDWANSNSIDFHAAAKPGSLDSLLLRAPIRAEHNGEPMVRFSYNLFRYGNVNASAAEMANAAAEPTDALGRIAEAGEAFFVANTIPVLVPDGCLLLWNNHRLLHGRGQYSDPARHLTRYWLA